MYILKVTQKVLDFFLFTLLTAYQYYLCCKKPILINFYFKIFSFSSLSHVRKFTDLYLHIFSIFPFLPLCIIM